MKTGETKATNSNTNSVNVVVNTPTATDSATGTVLYPPPLRECSGACLLPQDAAVDVPPMPQQEPNSDLEFYKLLSSILSDVLKDNNPKLIVNVIDTSGKIIVKAEDLLRLIAIKTHHDVKDVNLRYIEQEPGCMNKVSPIKQIEDIKINNCYCTNILILFSSGKIDRSSSQ